MLADEPHVVAAREILLRLREDERLVVFWREAEEKARAEEVIKVRGRRRDFFPFPGEKCALRVEFPVHLYLFAFWLLQTTRIYFFPSEICSPCILSPPPPPPKARLAQEVLLERERAVADKQSKVNHLVQEMLRASAACSIHDVATLQVSFAQKK